MEKQAFEDAKPGDRVWDIRYGWGTVTENTPPYHYPLGVLFDEVGDELGHIIEFDLTGRESSYYLHPTLYWGPVTIIMPPKPKRKVKKIIEGWVNIYVSGTIGNIRESSQECDKNVSSSRRAGEPFFIHHEYEEEVA